MRRPCRGLRRFGACRSQSAPLVLRTDPMESGRGQGAHAEPCLPPCIPVRRRHASAAGCCSRHLRGCPGRADRYRAVVNLAVRRPLKITSIAEASATLAVGGRRFTNVVCCVAVADGRGCWRSAGTSPHFHVGHRHLYGGFPACALASSVGVLIAARTGAQAAWLLRRPYALEQFGLEGGRRGIGQHRRMGCVRGRGTAAWRPRAGTSSSVCREFRAAIVAAPWA